jgi:uncharacterized protein YndB with AHSA1/START domain
MIPTILALASLLVSATPQNIQSPSTGPIVSEIVLDAPAGDVWRVLTTTEGMIEAGLIATGTDLELRIGSRWRTSYDADSNLDDETVIESEVLAFDPGRMFASRSLTAPADAPFGNAIRDTWTVTYLEPVGDSRTRVTIKMFGFSEDEESQTMRRFFEWGNPYQLDQLADYFRALPGS